MGEFWDRLNAAGRGAGQGFTFGWGDELGAKILAHLPKPDDPEGVGREYAGGSAENQYKNMYRADDAEAQRKHPGIYNSALMLSAAPAALATTPLGGLGAVGAGAAMGAASGAGFSENQGTELLKDAARGAALGGGTAAAGNLAVESAPILKAAWGKLRGGPPLAPALARAGGRVASEAVREASEVPQINMSQAVDEADFGALNPSASEPKDVHAAMREFDEAHPPPPKPPPNDEIRDPVARRKEHLPVDVDPNDPTSSTWWEIKNRLDELSPWERGATSRSKVMQSGKIVDELRPFDDLHEPPARQNELQALRKHLQQEEQKALDSTAYLREHMNMQKEAAAELAKANLAKLDPKTILGRGQARTVTPKDDFPEHVIKHAKGEEGLTQNYQEELLKGRSPHFPEIHDADRARTYVTAERVDPWKSDAQMAEYLGVPLEEVDSEGMWLKRLMGEGGNENAEEFRRMLTDIQRDAPEVDLRDLHKSSQYGRSRKTGAQKLLDPGFNP